MGIRVTDRGAWSIVDIQGRVDSFNQAKIISTIQELIEADKDKIALQLGPSQFLSFPTIRFLDTKATELRQKGGELALVSPSLKTRRHIEIFGSLDNLSIYAKTSDFEKSA